MKKILLTNDDGLFSEGIQHLKKSLSAKYDVYVVAPDRERSGVSMGLTINRPLRLNKVKDKEYMIDGTPADCINIALQKIVPQPPDFIISGMNLGENLSEDVLFSGTVAGAFTGYLYGIPALAVSLLARKEEINERDNKYNLADGARITGWIMERILSHKAKAAVYNLNIPFDHNGKIVPTKLGYKNYKPSIVERSDPRGKKYYWIGTGDPVSEGEEGTDLKVVSQGQISISVLKYDLNSKIELENISGLFK